MEVSVEMMKRHSIAQKAAGDIMRCLEGLTVVEALGVLKLVESGMLRYADVPEQEEAMH
jgi:hypothetical protein